MCIARPHDFNTILGQIPFRWIGETHHQMHMGMVEFIMKGDIPFQFPAVYLIVFTQKFYPAPQ